MSRTLNFGNRGRTPLARAVADPVDVESIKRRAWQDEGILVVRLDQVNGWMERQMVENIGTELYGKRKDRK